MSDLSLADQLQLRLLERKKQQVESSIPVATSDGSSPQESDEARFERIYNDESCWIASAFGSSRSGSILPL